MQATRTATHLRQREAQVLVTVVRCGQERGLVGLKVVDEAHASAGEHFIPFGVSKPSDEHNREFVYAGFIAALDRLSAMKLSRLVLLTDDATLVSELDRKIEPPRDLFLQYVILGCKLNEFVRAKVAVTPSERLQRLSAKTANLAATIYRENVGAAAARSTMLPLAPAI